MVLPILILGLSCGLFAYWMRYTVRMILDATFVEENSRRVIGLVHLNFPEVQAELVQQSQSQPLDGLYRDLHADYELLMSLLPAQRLMTSIDQILATVLFDLNRRRYYFCTKLLGGKECNCQRQALGSMAEMVRHLSSAIGSANA